eukprot:1357271-Rhodomonas_salina.1
MRHTHKQDCARRGGCDLPHGDPEGEDVTLRGVRLSAQQLRRHPERRPCPTTHTPVIIWSPRLSSLSCFSDKQDAE